MGRLWWVAVVATSGCSSVFGLGDPKPAPPDTPGASCTVAGFDLCAHQQPNGPIAFNGDTTIDTTLDCNVVVFDPSGGSVCVIYATDITVGATIRAQGKRPLALAATGTIVVDGTVDVSSSMAKGLGAGGDDGQCMFKRDAGYRSGGGAGGSFAGKGGDGGTGTIDPGTSGLASDPIQLPDRLRGGCAGGSVANGGGGVELVASTSITIAGTGRILANGGGGTGGGYLGGFQLGGGGGGSGGLIRIAAPSITVRGILTANGGGGGEGGDNAAATGMAGGDGTMSTTAALGGAGGGNGGDGGGGTGGATVAGGPGISPTAASLGGGGGGGGIGFIVLTGTAETTGATISPSPMM